MRVLSEGISFETVEDYTKKVEAIKSNYFTESATVAVEEEADLLQEENTEDAKPMITDEVSAYAHSISRSFAK